MKTNCALLVFVLSLFGCTTINLYKFELKADAPDATSSSSGDEFNPNEDETSSASSGVVDNDDAQAGGDTDDSSSEATGGGAGGEDPGQGGGGNTPVEGSGGADGNPNPEPTCDLPVTVELDVNIAWQHNTVQSGSAFGFGSHYYLNPCTVPQPLRQICIMQSDMGGSLVDFEAVYLMADNSKDLTISGEMDFVSGVVCFVPTPGAEPMLPAESATRLSIVGVMAETKPLAEIGPHSGDTKPVAIYPSNTNALKQ